MSIAIPVLVAAAWGALAFGGVYPWAYWPLLGSCVLIGAWGFFKRVPRARRGVNRPLAAGLMLVATAIAFQTIPLHRTTIRELSPATDEYLRQRNVNYALGAVLETRNADELRRAAAAVSNAESPIDGPRILELAAAASRHPLSIDPPKTALGLAFLAVFGLFFLGLVRALDGRDIRLIVQGLVGVGVVLAFAGIVQAALWNGKVYGFWQPINDGARPFGPFINANHFAGWMLMAVPLVVGYFLAQMTRGMAGVRPGWRNRAMWFATPDARRAVLAGFSALVMVFALVWTASRSGVACLLVAVVIWGFNILRYRGMSASRRLVLGLLILLFVAAAGWAGMGAALVRFESVDQGLAMRLGLWNDAWRIQEMFPVFGTGFNTYGSATVLYQTFQAGLLHYVEAHNDYLQILVEGGYLVAVPAAILLALFGWQVRARFREGRDDRTGYWLRLGAVTGIIAMACQEFVDFSLQIPGNFVLFAVLRAIAVRKATPKGRP